MAPRKRKRFVDLVRETGSIAQTRDLSKRRLAVKQRRALAPRDPAAAIAQLKAAGERYTKLAERLFNQIVAPAAGNPIALQAALAVFGRELDERARMVLPSARSAAKKAAKLASQEYARAMGVELPTTGVSTGAEAWAQQLVRDYQKIAADLVTAMLNPPDLESFDSVAASLRHRLWIVRNRTATAAVTRTEQFYGRVYRLWTERGGDGFSIWVTKRDKFVRDKHKAFEGRVFRTSEGIGGIQPGEEPNCRCKRLPASVDLSRASR